jgi:hypothetical protein
VLARQVLFHLSHNFSPWEVHLYEERLVQSLDKCPWTWSISLNTISKVEESKMLQVQSKNLLALYLRNKSNNNNNNKKITVTE